MTKFGITYIGYEKDEFGYLVKFSVRGIAYTYEMPFYWAEKIDCIARNSEPKALNMAKKQGTLVTKEPHGLKDKNTRKEVSNDNSTTKENDSGREIQGRPEASPRSEAIHTDNSDELGPNMAESSPTEAILRAREIVRQHQREGDAGGEEL